MQQHLRPSRYPEVCNSRVGIMQGSDRIFLVHDIVLTFADVLRLTNFLR